MRIISVKTRLVVLKRGLNVDFEFTDQYKRKLNIKIAVLPSTKAFFTHLDKGEKSFSEIFKAIRKDTGSKASDQELWNEVALNLNPLYSVGAILLRDKSIKPFNSFNELSE